MKKVFLKKEKEPLLQKRHPWVFSGAIHKEEDGLMPGEPVQVNDHQGNAVGFGFYFPSSIKIKFFHFGSDLPADVWTTKIHRALAYRSSFGLPSSHTNAFRCFFAEMDGIPGLIADYYNEILVLHFHHAGLHCFEEHIKNAFLRWEHWKIRCIWVESELKKEIIYSEDNNITHPVIISENNLLFYVDWKNGQKTGFYLDQRENRLKCERLSANKRILNLFCYTGAFTVYALRGGAREVVSVDGSEWATDHVKKHLLLNSFAEQEVHTTDVFDFLKKEHRLYDFIICDPPAFAKHIKNRHNAIMAYKRLNTMAMRILRPGGMLMTFSCSGVISRENFYHTIVSACMESRAEWNILEMLFPGCDHPMDTFFPEGDYLKGLLLIRKS